MIILPPQFVNKCMVSFILQPAFLKHFLMTFPPPQVVNKCMVSFIHQPAFLKHFLMTFPTPQVVNKGMVSFRDPDCAPGRGTKTLKVTRDCDLTKVFVRVVREAGPSGVAPSSGSGGDEETGALKAVERKIKEVEAVIYDSSGDVIEKKKENL